MKSVAKTRRKGGEVQAAEATKAGLPSAPASATGTTSTTSSFRPVKRRSALKSWQAGNGLVSIAVEDDDAVTVDTCKRCTLIGIRGRGGHLPSPEGVGVGTPRAVSISRNTLRVRVCRCLAGAARGPKTPSFGPNPPGFGRNMTSINIQSKASYRPPHALLRVG